MKNSIFIELLFSRFPSVPEEPNADLMVAKYLTEVSGIPYTKDLAVRLRGQAFDSWLRIFRCAINKESKS